MALRCVLFLLGCASGASARHQGVAFLSHFPNQGTQPRHTSARSNSRIFAQATSVSASVARHDVCRDPAPDPEPFTYIGPDLTPLSTSIKNLLDVTHPVLSASAHHFFDREGKRFRPAVVMLMGQATATSLDHVHSPAYVLQNGLASITEMIHTASLIHDDVLDESDTRRGSDAVHKLYSNKVAVLAGDYLLARASVALARLKHVAVVDIMAGALEALVQGEIMQIKSSPDDRLSFDYYLKKSYYKTASLIANSCKSSAILGGSDPDSAVAKAAEDYGYHMGLAFQIIDDMLDFTSDADTLGKPGLQDLALGLATAPVLYAAEEHPELKEVIKRKFTQAGDLDMAYSRIVDSSALDRTKKLAEYHAQAAVDAISILPETDAQRALIRLCHIVLSRKS